MATYNASNFVGRQLKIRAASAQPEWFSFTYKLTSDQTLASADVINFAEFGANQVVLAYAVNAKGSIAAATGNSLVKVGSVNVSGNVGDFGGDGGIAAGFATNADQVGSADGDDLSLTLGTLTTATTSGTRSITLRVLVANLEEMAVAERDVQTFP